MKNNKIFRKTWVWFVKGRGGYIKRIRSGEDGETREAFKEEERKRGWKERKRGEKREKGKRKNVLFSLLGILRGEDGEGEYRGFEACKLLIDKG